MEGQCPYSPYCTLKHGRDPKSTKVTGITFRLMVKSGTIFVKSTPKTSDKKATNGNHHTMLKVIQHGVMIAKF